MFNIYKILQTKLKSLNKNSVGAFIKGRKKMGWDLVMGCFIITKGESIKEIGLITKCMGRELSNTQTEE